MMGFWIGIILLILVVVGLSVGFGAMLNRRERGGRRQAGHGPHDPMTALKASGALRHRKSNRP